MVLTRARETLGFVLLVGGILFAPADLDAQRYLRQLAGIDVPAAEAVDETALRDSVVAMARAQLGRRYRWGGERPDEGFDCSGLVRYIMATFDLSLPRTAALQARIGREVPTDPDALRPGDLLTFGKGSRITHIGIYVGEGRFIHASSAAGRVVESPVVRPPHPRIRPWQGVRRLLSLGGDDAPERFPG